MKAKLQSLVHPTRCCSCFAPIKAGELCFTRIVSDPLTYATLYTRESECSYCRKRRLKKVTARIMKHILAHA